MADATKAPRKRRASSSSDEAAQDDAHSLALSNKRRFVLDEATEQTTRDSEQPSSNKELTKPLDVVVQTASPVARRRKRVVLNTPSPPERKKFNLLTGLASHVDILLQVTSYLPPQILLNLYSISAPFHYVMDSHFTAFIKAATFIWAPTADKYFPWWCYRQLCIEDPALRRPRSDRRSVSWDELVPEPAREIASQECSDSSDSQSSDISTSQRSVKSESPAERKTRIAELAQHRQKSAAPVPGFRWLKMVAYRESVCREIVGWMAAHGHRIPRVEGVDALKVRFDFLDSLHNNSNTLMTENVVPPGHPCQWPSHLFDPQHQLLHQRNACSFATLLHETRHALRRPGTLLRR